MAGPAKEAGWEIFDINTADGLAEAAYYSLLGTKGGMIFPLVLKVDASGPDGGTVLGLEEAQELLAARS